MNVRQGSYNSLFIREDTQFCKNLLVTSIQVIRDVENLRPAASLVQSPESSAAHRYILTAGDNLSVGA